MNILHVIRDLSPTTGGPVTAVLGMAKEQAHMGQTVTIAATDYGSNEPPKIDNVIVQYYPVTLGLWRWAVTLSASLTSLVKAADIVHIHMLWEHPTLAAAAACRAAGRPYIIRPCGMLDGWSLAQNRWRKRIYMRFVLNTILRNAAAIHYTSSAEQAGSEKMTPNRSSFVIPIGLPAGSVTYEPSTLAFTKRYPALMGKRLILFLGRLHYKKQPNVLIDAFSWIASRMPDVHLVLAGSGAADYIGKLQAYVKAHGLERRVTFAGLLDRKAVREALAVAEIFVLPSLRENFGIAATEAMAAGCPVIVSNRVDLAPAIERANAGIVCQPEAREIALAMDKILNDTELRRRMADNGRKLVAEQFMWEKVAVTLNEVYEDILSGSRKSSAWNIVNNNFPTSEHIGDKESENDNTRFNAISR